MKSNQPAQVRRRTEITVEREVLSVYYAPARNYHGFCPQCSNEVLMMTAETACAALGVTMRQLYRWLEESRFHFQETNAGETFICSASLATHQAKSPHRNAHPSIISGKTI